MVSKEKDQRRLKRIEERLQALRDLAIPESERTGLDSIRGPEDRAICIKFMTEVYHEGISEEIWAAQHPEEYQRLIRIAGLVPAEPDPGPPAPKR